jgi:hypothetical protein
MVMVYYRKVNLAILELLIKEIFILIAVQSFV